MTDVNAPQDPQDAAQAPAVTTTENITPNTPGTGETPAETAQQQEAREVNIYADPFKDPRPEPGTVFYCPACGKRVAYRQQCSGTPEQPHQPQEVVDAVELWDALGYEDARGRQVEDQHDPSKLTAAAPSPGDSGDVA